MSEPQITQPAPKPQLSPKEGFLRLEEICNAWRSTVRSNVMSTAMIYALAEYSTAKPSSEQLKGAQDFISVMLTLAEPKSEPRGAFPDKRLTSTSSEPTDSKPPTGK